MSKSARDKLNHENNDLRQRLANAEETLRAITNGEIDALVVGTKFGERVFTFEGADSVYRLVIESINEGAITISPLGTILYANKYFAKMMKSDLSHVIGASIFDFTNLENRRSLAAMMDQDSCSQEIWLSASDGSPVPAYIATQKIQFDNLSICAVVTDLSEQKHSQELMVLKDRLADAQRLSKTGSWEWNLETGEISWSDEMFTLLGLEKKNFIPHIHAFDQFVHGDDLPFFTGMMSNLIDHGGCASMDLRIRKTDGTIRFFHSERRMIKLKPSDEKPFLLIGTDQDITEQKKIELALKDSEEHLRSVLESSRDVITRMDLVQNRLEYVSHACESILGYTRAELANIDFQTYSSMVHPEDLPLLQQAHQRAVATGFAEAEYRQRHKDGRYIWVSSRMSTSTDESGQTSYLTSNIRDITDRKKTETELMLRTQEIEMANKELESFSYSVSHDLRAPLRTLDGFSQFILEDYQDQLDDKGREYLYRIREASQKMSQLINDLLRLSHITKSEMKKEEVNLSELACSIVDGLAVSAGGRQVSVVVAPALVVECDRQFLKVLLTNLIDNAWKFTSRRSDARIEVGMLQDAGKNIYFIKDNGAGFDMNYYNKLFKPFERLHTMRVFRARGSDWLSAAESFNCTAAVSGLNPARITVRHSISPLADFQN